MSWAKNPTTKLIALIMLDNQPPPEAYAGFLEGGFH